MDVYAKMPKGLPLTWLRRQAAMHRLRPGEDGADVFEQARLWWCSLFFFRAT